MLDSDVVYKNSAGAVVSLVEELDLNPLSVEGDPDEMWGFIGYELPETTVEEMRNRGYEVSLYEDMWMGKYGCNLYHFVK